MEMNLPNLVVFLDPIIFGNTLALASAPAIFLWISNRGEWEKYGFLDVYNKRWPDPG